jgi:hypothetical protein
MTHPWREHIKLTKEKNPTIKNFGEIIKLGKLTYAKTSNKKTQKKCNSDNNKKTLKKVGNTQQEGKGEIIIDDLTEDVERKHTGGGEIMADKLDMNRSPRRYKAIKEGPCLFPFKYNNKTYNDCAESKDGRWCATELKDVKSRAGNNVSKWGYCETHYLTGDSKKEKKYTSSSDSSQKSSSDDVDDDNIISELIEYGDEKYLLETSTRNVYSLSIEIKKQLIADGVIPEEDFGDIDEKSPLYSEYQFIGRMLPNGTIFYLEDGAEEYEPSKKKIKENSSDSISPGKTSGGGKYGIYNKEVSIIEKYGDIYKVKDNNGDFILTYKNNII